MDRRNVVRTLAFIILGLAVFYIVVYGFFSIILPDEDTRSLIILRTKGGYILDIRADSSVELSQGIYCAVLKNDDTIFPLRMIGRTRIDSRELEFALIEAEDNLVAVIEQSAPHVILAIYDLNNRQSGRKSQTIRQELLLRLNKLNPEEPFIFVDGIGGISDIKVH